MCLRYQYSSYNFIPSWPNHCKKVSSCMNHLWILTQTQSHPKILKIIKEISKNMYILLLYIKHWSVCHYSYDNCFIFICTYIYKNCKLSRLIKYVVSECLKNCWIQRLMHRVRKAFFIEIPFCLCYLFLYPLIWHVDWLVIPLCIG